MQVALKLKYYLARIHIEEPEIYALKAQRWLLRCDQSLFNEYTTIQKYTTRISRIYVI